MALKLPRKDTRVRAIFDLMYKNALLGTGTRFRDAKVVYDDTHPSYNHKMFGPRYHSGMNVSRTLGKFGYRASRGYYVMHDLWLESANGNFREELNKRNPCAEITLPDCHDVACTCKAMVWEKNDRKYLQNSFPDGYKAVSDKGLHFLDGRPCIPYTVIRAAPSICTDPNCLTCSPQPDPADDRFVAKKIDLIDDERVKVIEALEDTLASKNKTIDTLNALLIEVMSDVIAIRDGSLYNSATRLTNLHNKLKSCYMSSIKQ